LNSKVTVVILNWNGLALLQRFLSSVTSSTYPNLDIVLADNASEDASVAWTQTNFPTIQVIRHAQNWGFSKGNNEAIRQTGGDYVALLNNDVEVTSDWLEPLVGELDRNPDVAAVQPKLLDVNSKSRFEYAGGSGGRMDRHGFTFTRGRLFDSIEEDTGQYDDTQEIFWATGAAILLRRAVLETTGLLDERFEFHMEEIDLCWRIRRAGFGIRVVPASRVYHAGGSSLPRGSSKKAYYNYRNSLLMLHKNLPQNGRFRTLAVRLLLDVIALLRSLLTFNGGDAWAMVRAYKDFLDIRGQTSGVSYQAPDIRDKTSETREDPGMVDVLPSYTGSIILDYFLRGRKTFSDLPSGKFRLGHDAD